MIPVFKSSTVNLSIDKFTVEDLKTGINIELEHGLIDPKTNVTDNSLILTMKIALAHLNEFPDYYNKDYGLPALEEYLKSKTSFYNKKPLV